MTYIYKITNRLNQKIYIGKTLKDISTRWKEHCKDYKKESEQNRPLYFAMKKYGIENFYIEQVEECLPERASEREKYWIEFYQSFKHGYNATIGGDGKPYCNYELVYSLFQKGLNLTQISKILNYSTDTCSYALKNYHVSHEEIVRQGRQVICKTVIQRDKNTNQILNIFPSVQSACDFLGKRSSGHIAEVCTGKRKTAYGYKWEYGNVI